MIYWHWPSSNCFPLEVIWVLFCEIFSLEAAELPAFRGGCLSQLSTSHCSALLNSSHREADPDQDHARKGGFFSLFAPLQILLPCGCWALRGNGAFFSNGWGNCFRKGNTLPYEWLVLMAHQLFSHHRHLRWWRFLFA